MSALKYLAALCTAALSLMALQPTDAKSVETDEARLKREVAAFFQQAFPQLGFRSIVRDSNPSPVECQFKDEWLRSPAPQDLAREYLGFRLNADLIGAIPFGLRPSDLIGADLLNHEAFCDEQTLDAKTDELKNTFLNDKTTTGFIIIKSINNISYPIFDEKFENAIISTSYESTSLGKASNNTLSPLRGYGTGNAHVYKKENGHWRLVKSIRTFIYE